MVRDLDGRSQQTVPDRRARRRPSPASSEATREHRPHLLRHAARRRSRERTRPRSAGWTAAATTVASSSSTFATTPASSRWSSTPTTRPRRTGPRAKHVSSGCCASRARSGCASPENVNPKRETGEVELRASACTVLAIAKTPPFPVNEDTEVDEQLRLRHRYLDLRRVHLQRNLRARAKFCTELRRAMAEIGFLEIETPMMIRATPEGRSRLPRAEPAVPGQLLRAAAIAPAVQAALHGRRLRQVLPAGALHARRGPARRSPAGVHAARHRDVLRR